MLFKYISISCFFIGLALERYSNAFTGGFVYWLGIRMLFKYTYMLLLLSAWNKNLIIHLHVALLILFGIRLLFKYTYIWLCLLAWH